MQIPSSRMNEKEEGAEEPLLLKRHLGSSTDKVCLYSVDQHFVEWLLLPGGEAGKYDYIGGCYILEILGIKEGK